MKPIKTRFAPSPTGYLHIGGLRTALYAWAFAKKHGGQFLLRIEDTDKARSTQESVNAILDGMAWAGLEADNADNILYQSHNMPRYRQLLQQLIDDGKAYYCYLSADELANMRNHHGAYDQRWRPEVGKNLPPIPDDVMPVIRFKTPIDGVTSWVDGALGEISFDNSNLDDFIIARADGSPVYNFCVVADDADMGISHVIRGDDHINNTPKQILLYQALGFDVPEFVHLPMILNAEGKKLSKRGIAMPLDSFHIPKNNNHTETKRNTNVPLDNLNLSDTVAVTDFAAKGILPEALLNYLARLGWGSQNQELFTLSEFVQMFDLKDISHASARMDAKKLLWINHEHIKRMDNDNLADIIHKYSGIPNDIQPVLKDVIDLVKSRAQDLNELTMECFPFYQKDIPKPSDMEKYWDNDTPDRLQKFSVLLENLSDWTTENLVDLVKDFCQEHQIKMAVLAMPLRLAVFGRSNTPPIDKALAILGKEETLNRLKSI